MGIFVAVDSSEAKGIAVPSFVITGKFGSGKSLYAKRLREAMQNRFGITVHMAPPLSEKISEVARDLFHMEEKDRSLLQVVANKMREINTAVWAEAVISKIDDGRKVPFVVESVRHPAEVEAFRKRYPGVVVLRLVVDETKRREAYHRTYGRYPTQQQLEDPSEAVVDMIRPDIEVHNDYSEEALTRQISVLLNAVETKTISKLTEL